MKRNAVQVLVRTNRAQIIMIDVRDVLDLARQHADNNITKQVRQGCIDWSTRRHDALPRIPRGHCETHGMKVLCPHPHALRRNHEEVAQCLS
jgi:hypothetical protein